MLHGYLPAILEGLSLDAAGLGGVAGRSPACSGLPAPVAKLSASRAARLVADVYTTLIRGLPELVLMLMIFYGGQIAINSARRGRATATSTSTPSSPAR